MDKIFSIKVEHKIGQKLDSFIRGICKSKPKVINSEKNYIDYYNSIRF